MGRTGALAALWLMLFAACGGEESTSSGTVMPQWTVASEADLSIGGEEDAADPLYRVGGAVRLSTGYAISNRSADEVRFYDQVGRLVARNGRDGSGPREFRNPHILGVLPGDSVVVYDSSNDRLSIICDGTAICVELPIRHRGQVVGVGRNHAVITLEFPAGELSAGREDRLFQVIALNRATLELDTLVVLDGQPWQVGGSENALFRMPLPMTRAPQVAVSSEAVIVANGRDAILQVLDFAGEELRTIRLPIELQPVSEAEFRSTAKASVSPVIDGEPALADMINALEPPPFRAPIRRVLLDRTGLLWVELDQEERDLHKWIVADPTGGARATVTTPIGVTVLDIGEDYVLGLAQDSLDVEYVRQYSLSRR